MNKLGGRKTHHGFQMHSLGSETLASVFLTTEGLLTVNMFKLWSGSTVLIDTVLIRAFQECLWLGWHRWLFANIANNHRQNHADITAGRLVTGSSACRGWQAAGCSEALRCGEKSDGCKPGLGEKCFPVFLKYSLNSTERGEWLRKDSSMQQPTCNTEVRHSWFLMRRLRSDRHGGRRC